MNLKMNSLYALPVVALLGVAACGGSNSNQQQPMTPAAGQSTAGQQPEGTMPQAGVGNTNDQTPSDMNSATGQGTQQGGINSQGGSMGTTGSTGMSGATGQGQGTMGQGPGQGMGQSGSMGAGTSSDQGTLSDAQIASVVDSLNRGEEKEAQLAVGKAKDAKVKQFAQMMLTGHRDANRKLMQTVKGANITPASSTVSTQLEDTTTQSVDTLRGKTGTDFDKAYIDDQVKMHTQALDMLDNRLIPNAKNDKLKSELQTTRATVADHLRRAQDIQANLGTTPSSNSPTNTQPSGSQGGSQGGSQSPSTGSQNNPYPKR